MRAAIVIGVDHVGGGLQKLSAAASGAREVAAWLERNDYHVQLFTDCDAPVERSAIFQAVKALVDAKNVERLVIYFAGHGFLKSPVDEYWLLSGAPDDAAEAVNVTVSASSARYKGIPEIIFISDACRVVPKTGVHSGIVGASIFPNTPPTAQGAEIDFYYGTHPGDPAHERSDTDAKKAHGLFTQELLDAHKGAPPDALLQVKDLYYVRNRWLKQVLRDRVDLRAQKISLALTQKPDVQIQIFDGYIAQNEAAEENIRSAQEPHYKGFSKSRAAGWRVRGKQGGSMSYEAGWKDSDQSPDYVEFEAGEASNNMIVDEATKADPSFQARLSKIRTYPDKAEVAPLEEGGLRQYLLCRGGSIKQISSAPSLKVEQGDSEDNSSLFRFELKEPAAQIAVRFEDGTGMLVPMLRDYACEIVRHEGRTYSLAYSWIQYSDPDLYDLRAEVIGAATLGMLNRNREAARAFAARIRKGKRSDPILGLVASLAYTIAGDFAGARSVRGYMLNDLQVDLFDSWLFSGAQREPPIVPALPLLGQTWSFMEAFDTPVPEGLKKLPRVPGFWTVFEPEGMDTVMQLAESDI